MIDPETLAEIFDKNYLFPARNLIFRKNWPQSQGQFSKLNDFGKRRNLDALEKKFFRGE
jgi:hypothetical protein